MNNNLIGWAIAALIIGGIVGYMVGAAESNLTWKWLTAKKCRPYQHWKQSETRAMSSVVSRRGCPDFQMWMTVVTGLGWMLTFAALLQLQYWEMLTM